ncbi:hypothetical protein D3C80_1517640 [compost metagenome]
MPVVVKPLVPTAAGQMHRDHLVQWQGVEVVAQVEVFQIQVIGVDVVQVQMQKGAGLLHESGQELGFTHFRARTLQIIGGVFMGQRRPVMRLQRLRAFGAAQHLGIGKLQRAAPDIQPGVVAVKTMVGDPWAVQHLG